MTTFTLTLKLGNDAMRTGTDVANALTRAAGYLEEYYPMGLDASDSMSLIDQNGHRVGEWIVSDN